MAHDTLMSMAHAHPPSDNDVALTSVVPFAPGHPDSVGLGHVSWEHAPEQLRQPAELGEREVMAGFEAQRNAIRQLALFLDQAGEMYGELLRQNAELRLRGASGAEGADSNGVSAPSGSAPAWATSALSLTPSPAGPASERKPPEPIFTSVVRAVSEKSSKSTKRTRLQDFLAARAKDRRDITKQQTTAWGDLSATPRSASGSKRQLICAEIANGGMFEFMQVFLIMSHAVLGGWRTSQEAQDQIEAAKSGGVVLDDWSWWDACDIFFIVAFSVELVVRVLAEEWAFFSGRERSSNLFDVVMWASLFADAGASIQDGNVFQFLRPLRVFRVLRLAKVRDNIPEYVRRKSYMQWFNNLFELLDAAIRALNALVPVISVLILTFYMIALCTVSGVDSFARRIDTNSSEDHHEAFEIMSRRYSSIPVAMFTLLQAFVGLMYTSEYYHPVLHMHPLTAATFIVLWIVLRWIVQNVVIGEVCNVIRNVRSPGLREALKLEAKKMHEHIEVLMALFAEKEASFGAMLNQKELAEVLTDPHLVFMLGLPRWQAMELHRYLDPEDKGLKVRLLVEGAVQLRKPPKCIDMLLLQDDITKIHHDLATLMAAHRIGDGSSPMAADSKSFLDSK